MIHYNYEAIAPKLEHKPITKPEYRSLGVEPISPIDNKKQISEVLVTSQFNKHKRTMKVNEGQKTEVTRASKPKNNNIHKIMYTKISKFSFIFLYFKICVSAQ